MLALFNIMLHAQSWLSVQKIDANLAYVCGSNGAFGKSTDGGYSWKIQTLTSVTLECLCFTDANTGWIVGSNAFGSDVVMKTTDGGQSWNPQDIGMSVPDLRGIAALNSNVVIIVGKNAILKGLILRTTDGGATWNNILNAGAYPLYAVTFTDANNVVAVGWGTMMRSTDGGSSWTKTFSSTSDIYMSIKFANQNQGFAVGSAGPSVGVVYSTSDGGSTWAQLFRGGGAELYSIASPSSSILYTSGAYGHIMKSTNSGNSWVNQIQYAATSLSFISPDIGMVVGGNNLILRTTDGGATWRANGDTAAITGSGGSTTTNIAHLSVQSFLDFGNVKVGTSKSLPLTISNTGSATLNISKISTSGVFRSNIASLTLLTGASSTITITFTPTQKISYSSVIGFSSNADNPSVSTIASGTGTRK